MAEKGNPYQNAVAERISRTFKEQLRMNKTFDGYHQAMNHLIQSVETYNQRRPHTSCDKMTLQEAHQVEGPLKKHWKNHSRKTDKGGGADALHTSSQV